jgi:hypothetical protein
MKKMIKMTNGIRPFRDGSTGSQARISPQRKREKLFEVLLDQLEAEARRRPVLMVFEDAHWIDPTSREFLILGASGAGKSSFLRRTARLCVAWLAIGGSKGWRQRPHSPISMPECGCS